jgi:hypothetical protein
METLFEIFGIMLPSALILIIFLAPSVIARIAARCAFAAADARKQARRYILITYVPLTLVIIVAMTRYPELPFEKNVMYAAIINAIFGLVAYFISVVILRSAKRRPAEEEQECDPKR